VVTRRPHQPVFLNHLTLLVFVERCAELASYLGSREDHLLAVVKDFVWPRCFSLRCFKFGKGSRPCVWDACQCELIFITSLCVNRGLRSFAVIKIEVSD
jgi:hypothetical protein